MTDVIEGEIGYTLIDKVEELNRDGSHRGWSKRIVIDGLNVFGREFNQIRTSIANYNLFSSEKFNGTIGLEYFQSSVITLDYAGRRIAVGSSPIDYEILNHDKYIVLPLLKTSDTSQEHLPFFEAEYQGQPIMVYLDTGKNYSYVLNPNSQTTTADKPANLIDVPVKIGDMPLVLKDVAEINHLAQAEGLPYPTTIELNSDQIWKCGLLVTFDLFEQKIIFRRR